VSSATSVLIYVPLDVDERLVEHLLRFEWDGRRADFRELDTGDAGGGKGFGGLVLAAGLNYLPQDEFVAHLQAFDWPYPEATVVLFNHEYADHVAAWRPGGRP
jgi:hypothetical protein